MFLAWRGGCDEAEEAGCVAELVVEVFSETDAGLYERVTTRHIQRHHPRAEVERALAGAGLAAVAVFGQLPDGSLDRGRRGPPPQARLLRPASRERR